jgi:hypothetical protein
VFTPGGQLRPWVSKYSPWGEVNNGPLCVNCDEKWVWLHSGRFTRTRLVTLVPAIEVKGKGPLDRFLDNMSRLLMYKCFFSSGKRKFYFESVPVIMFGGLAK